MLQERLLKDCGNDRQYASIVSELKQRPASIFNKESVVYHKYFGRDIY